MCFVFHAWDYFKTEWKSFSFRFFCLMNLNLHIFPLSSKCLLQKIEKKNYYEKLRHLVKIVFDGLALGNCVLNNKANSSLETLKGLEFFQW